MVAVKGHVISVFRLKSLKKQSAPDENQAHFIRNEKVFYG
jgi:hypothetical protein